MKPKKHKSFNQVNQVRLDFTEKPITAWGGIGSIIAKYLETINFRSWVTDHIPIQEKSNNGRGIYEKVLASFLTVLVGGNRFSHLLLWQHGVEAIQKSFDVDWLPKAVSVITRFWGKIDSQKLAEQVADSCRALCQEIIQWEGIKCENLNLDSTVVTRYGEQEGAKKGYNPKKKGRLSHNPLIAFLASGYIANLWNRSGNTSSGQNAKEFFQQTIVALGDKFIPRRVLCDSGYYLIDFMEYLENSGYFYIIAVPLIPVLRKKVEQLTTWKKTAEGIEISEFDFTHADCKWTKPRRYVVVRKRVKQRPKAAGKEIMLFDLGEPEKYRISVMTTNDYELEKEQVWNEYRPRANDENVIKDLKEGYGLDAFCLNNFWATESFMLMNALVFHNLINYLNRNILNVKSPKEHFKTLRIKYLILPAQLGSEGGRPVLRLAVRNRKWRSKIKYILAQIDALSISLKSNAFENP